MSGNKDTLNAMNSIYLDRVIPLQQLKTISDAFAVDIVDAFNKWNIGVLSQQELELSVLTAKDVVADTWENYHSTHLTDDERAISKKLTVEINAIKQELVVLLEETRKQTEDKNKIINNVYNHIEPLSGQIDNLINIQLTTSEHIYQTSKNTYEANVQLGIILLIAACMTGFIFSFWIIRKELRVLPEITDTIQKMSDGDFTPREMTKANNELDLITSSLQTLQHSIFSIIESSERIQEQLAVNQTQISTVIHNNSENAQRELSEIEQVAAAATELSSTASDVAHNAHSAETAAIEAISIINASSNTLQRSDSIAESVSVSMKESARIINELREHSEKISSVVDVINSISEQTNLLALNAAIEAARAGEQGRGFAVVADEVRALAAKTQKSTIDIQTIISQLQEQSKLADEHVKLNTDMVSESQVITQALSDAFKTISEQVGQISDINALVATASEEQSSVTNDISHRLEEISQIVQKNSENASQTTLANNDISTLTQHLRKEMAFFKVR